MISLTPAAQKQIARQIQQRGSGVGLRIAVKKSGCSGWSYVLDYADAIGDNDVLYGEGTAQVVVSREHLDKLNGLTLDYVKEGLNQHFQFSNPNAKALCGCGESFAV